MEDLGDRSHIEVNSVNNEVALELLAKVMDWQLDKAVDEMRWWKLISAVKYDGYRDFLAGARFLESLVGWLLQFSEEDREAAYKFARHRLVYVSALERERLIQAMYPRTVYPRLLKAVANKAQIPPWKVHKSGELMKQVRIARRRTLFLGLSDGARLDSFRHANVGGRISNEQVVMGAQLDKRKWADLKKDLTRDLQHLGADIEPTFDCIYLVDDFSASGTSFLRNEGSDEGADWKGKLPRFLESLGFNEDPIQADNWRLIVHHLMITDKACKHLQDSIQEFMACADECLPRFSDYEVTYGHKFSERLPVQEGCPLDEEVIPLTDDYYDNAIETPATRKGGVDHLGMGYAACGLPLVLDHNTPNNSLAMLWAESAGKNGSHQMRPLFRRRQRHE